jgi:hypothetical protein
VATRYQNLMRQNPNLTRSRATKFCLSPIRHRINKKGWRLARVRVSNTSLQHPLPWRQARCQLDHLRIAY